jgi:hypothetical protein
LCQTPPQEFIARLNDIVNEVNTAYKAEPEGTAKELLETASSHLITGLLMLKGPGSAGDTLTSAGGLGVDVPSGHPQSDQLDPIKRHDDLPLACGDHRTSPAAVLAEKSVPIRRALTPWS